MAAGRCWFIDGIFFCRTPGHLRPQYTQADGAVVEGEICTCYEDPILCPIDEHAIEARMVEMEDEDCLRSL